MVTAHGSPVMQPGAGTGRSAETRAALVAGAIDALREVGFTGTSAREIARRAGCNQALVFYHFGSVTGLLLAALDEVSARRLTAYQDLLDHAGTFTELVESARAVFNGDLEEGYVTVLVELIAGARSAPGLGEQVAARLLPWRELAAAAVRRAVATSPIGPLVATGPVAHAVVAGILGVELLAHLDADRVPALEIFDQAAALAGLVDLPDQPFLPDQPHLPDQPMGDQT